MFNEQTKFLPVGYPLGFKLSTTDYIIERIGRDNLVLPLEHFKVWSSAFLDDFKYNDEDKETIDLFVKNGLLLEYSNFYELFNEIYTLNMMRCGIGWQDNGDVSIMMGEQSTPINSLQYAIWQKSNGRRTVDSVYSGKYINMEHCKDNFSEIFTKSIVFLVKNTLLYLR
jgi:hypothetical protein